MSKSFTNKNHIEHLRMVLQRLQIVNLKLNSKKCCFRCQVVEYLGHILTPDELRPNPERIDAVKQFAISHYVRTVLAAEASLK